MFIVNFIKKKLRRTYHKFLNYNFVFGNIKFIFCKICEICKFDKNASLRKFIFGKYKVVLVMPVYNVEKSMSVMKDLLPQIETDNALLLIILNGRKKKNIKKFSQFTKLTKNIKIKYDKRKLGSVISFNLGTKFALSRYSPSYVGFVSDHDKIAPDWLRTLITQLDVDEKRPFSWAPTVIKDYKNITSFDEHDEGDFEKATLMLDGIKGVFKNNKILQPALTHLLGDDSHGKSNSMIYGIFRTNVFDHIGLIPHTLFPDVIFLLKVAVRYGLPVENKKTYREDNRSNKNQTPSEIVQNQLNVVFGYEARVNTDDAIKDYIRMYMNVLQENFEGKYLLKNMSYEHYALFDSLHKLNVVRKFSHLLGNETQIIAKIRRNDYIRD
jgi:hypothetical protein|uniref:Predicted glycosyl transferase HI1578 n=1 Tax=uncultured bacterium BAC13K9BAC TaxID=332979 RepID=Q4JMW2_9BACT|nr:predicted glycosyl transferase HI1578 [uncultured bacterium BAC13K9BAC]